MIDVTLRYRFENKAARIEQRILYTKVEIKDYNVKAGDRNLFGKPVKNDVKTYETLEKLLWLKEMTTQPAVH